VVLPFTRTFLKERKNPPALIGGAHLLNALAKLHGLHQSAGNIATSAPQGAIDVV